ncbi:MAG: DUF881 domain-containing protein [Abditibacteriota bacterium]|nr:DUF881 domain-containing protein [Abditibacteriota bacterium]
MVPISHGKSWLVQLVILCFILGVLFALTFKTQIQAMREGIPIRMADAGSLLKYAKDENIKLQKELAEQKQLTEKMAKEQANGVVSTQRLENILKESKLLAGTSRVSGPGVIVTLIDSPKISKDSPAYEIDQLLVHYSDIVLTVNELFNSGAEAVSVNEQRIVANTSIRCAGTPILVNNIRVFPPYVIKAIGNADDLYTGINMPGGTVADLQVLGMLSVTKEKKLEIPAYTGSSKFTYAKEETN